MKIKVDTREPKKIKSYLEKLGFEVELTALPVGDVLFEDENKKIIFERKSYSDFIFSIKSKHIHKQLLQMQNNYENCYLLISGDYKQLFHEKIQWTTNQNAGSIASLLVRFPKIRIGFFPNDKQLCYAIRAIISKTDDGKVVDVRDTELLKNTMTNEDYRLKVLMCFPRIGQKRATKLLEKEEHSGIGHALDKIVNFMLDKN